MAVSRSLVLLVLSAACALAEPQLFGPQPAGWNPAAVPGYPVVPVPGYPVVPVPSYPVAPVAPAGFPAAPGTLSQNTEVIGDCKSDDRLLYVQTVRKSSKWMQVRSEVVSYPAEGQAGGLISCIRLEALKTDNKGSAIVQKGGPGQRVVDVKVKSDRGHSVAWNVLIYGK